MRDRIRVTKARFHCAPSASREHGLLGWIDFVLDDAIGVDGVEIRRVHGGRLALVYPRRLDRSQREHYIVRPLDHATRVSIEKQVFDALAKDGSLVVDALGRAGEGGRDA